MLEKIKARKYTIAYSVITLLVVLTVILALCLPALYQKSVYYTPFEALSIYLGMGADQGFASLGAAIFTIVPLLFAVPTLVASIIGIIRNKPGKLFSGFFVPALILEIVWVVLLNKNRDLGFQTFFDMTLTCKAATGAYVLIVFTAILFVGLTVYGFIQKKWGKADYPEKYARDEETI